jgi:hypothetical protein
MTNLDIKPVVNLSVEVEGEGELYEEYHNIVTTKGKTMFFNDIFLYGTATPTNVSCDIVGVQIGSSSQQATVSDTGCVSVIDSVWDAKGLGYFCTTPNTFSKIGGTILTPYNSFYMTATYESASVNGTTLLSDIVYKAVFNNTYCAGNGTGSTIYSGVISEACLLIGGVSVYSFFPTIAGTTNGATTSYARNVLSTPVTKSVANKLTLTWTCSFGL